MTHREKEKQDGNGEPAKAPTVHQRHVPSSGEVAERLAAHAAQREALNGVSRRAGPLRLAFRRA
ncbi:MAG: hypothetical protein KGH69_01195 [Candidatus Micrarchaeota archaeon]|nr:hypothetical protein [Candidatus Micrarchaeota archaeon]MDE1851290.1 hypothetical protein [Candidatus Micrarchaeota archaeon]